VKLLILVVDDEPDVDLLFRQQFRHDLRAGRFTMEFAQSGDMALQRITDATDVSIILILSDINMPGMTGLELLPKAKAVRPDVPVIMITAYGDAETKRKALEAAPRRFLPSRSISGRFAARSMYGSNALQDSRFMTARPTPQGGSKLFLRCQSADRSPGLPLLNVQIFSSGPTPAWDKVLGISSHEATRQKIGRPGCT
jgi:CheY-like chemotaxis protein